MNKNRQNEWVRKRYRVRAGGRGMEEGKKSMKTFQKWQNEGQTEGFWNSIEPYLRFAERHRRKISGFHKFLSFSFSSFFYWIKLNVSQKKGEKSFVFHSFMLRSSRCCVLWYYRKKVDHCFFPSVFNPVAIFTAF